MTRQLTLPVPVDVRADAIEAIHAATAIYTTAPTVEALLDKVGWPAPGERLLDPAAGDGAFVLAALARLDLDGDRTDPTIIPVRGFEIHGGAVKDARRRVTEHFRARGWRDRRALAAAELIVQVGDFLTWGEIGRFGRIVGNPPYLRFNRLPDYFKALYGGRLPEHAKADLQHAFLDRCTELLTDDGRMGFVTADRWLFNEGAAALRETIGRRFGLVHVGRIDARTAFYRPKRRATGTPPRVHPVEVIFGNGPDVLRLDRGAISPDSGKARSSESGPTLADVAEIRLAPWLGPDGIFVLDAAAAAGLPAAELVAAIKPRDIHPDRDVLISVGRCVAIRTTAEREPSAKILAHLRARMQLMPPRGQRPMDKPGWWLPPEPITLKLDRPALLIPRISNRLRIIQLPAGVLPLNHAMTVVSTDGTRGLDEIELYLRSEPAQAWIGEHAARLENGFLSITTNLLRRLPVPWPRR